VAVPAAAILLLLGFLGLRLYQHNSRVRWVREQVIPAVPGMLESADYKGAFRLLRRAQAILPHDPAMEKLRRDISSPFSVSTNPPGAEVWAGEYGAQDDDWQRLGTTPLTTELLPSLYYRFRIVKPGFQTILSAGGAFAGPLEFDMDPEGTLPLDMVRVTGGVARITGLDAAKVGAFLIDRYETTNKQFKKFIDSGGYRKPEYWKQDFEQNGRKLTWEEATQLFRDFSGRPGPASWEFGEYPQGQEDYPVSGVSWYEAAAYAEFAGKQLPTIYHWERAASPGTYSDMAAASNFGGAGPARVGAYKGIGPFGALDMAGNVKEWCWNQFGSQRYIRGGAWNEPEYMTAWPDTRSPWDRSLQNGFRCARYDAREDSSSQAPVTRAIRDYSKEKPVSDEVFRLYRSLYAYDPTALDARVEGIDEENSYWKREKVSFAAVYGNERVPAYFYIPKHATPPYQTILYLSHMGVNWPSLQPQEVHSFDYLIKSGRAVLVPVLKGYFQRRYPTPSSGPNASRDRIILESKDFRRSIDYLVSRADVDHDRLGVFGMSRGLVAPLLDAGDERLKAAVLLGVGLGFGRPLPEADLFNFLPRFRVPTLIVSGRYDFIFPLETSVRPMFRALGAPEKDKLLIVMDGGHVPPNGQNRSKETIEWFDHRLGPVR
jgi:dienelactone hydrolase